MSLFTTINHEDFPDIVTINGTIAADGKILDGCGFTVDYLGIGCYVVEFNKPFIGQLPEISISVSGFSQGTTAKVIDKNLSGFKYFTIKIDPDIMYLKDYKINFSATGLGNSLIPGSLSGFRSSEISECNNDPETRIIQGSISPDGKITSGEGFTVKRINTGAYIVTFDKPFDYISPNPLALEVVNPYIDPYGYKVDIIGKLYTNQFKYFTYLLEDTALTMKDIALSKFMVWGS